VSRRLPDALDKMSEIFLAAGILKPLAERSKTESACRQEPTLDEMTVIL
jgi:hypothetical protein